MKIIVGLGNPGPKYTETRHNIGFKILDQLSQDLSLPKQERKAKCILNIGTYNDIDVVLVKPRTFINNSGIAIKYIMDRFKVTKEDILIIYDDVALPVGKIRIRENGSSGGHNGIKSIIDALQTSIFQRLRIGVGSPNNDSIDMINWVLGKFNNEDKKIINNCVADCSEIVKFWMTNDINTTMNTYN
ncbi:MAG TPA: aminoacyl-tRNA hydrolase [Dehalococcoidia bacterium]|jgi:peptidyl-tRNA hydrolase, PTH1 family|nr:aminoacyl-tRNA hydrolase [Dehalococcoidia bacterium]|tara:strand:- start:4416 stop:4976 length:561 start_codon:yes stop_codon:yes gene_type:complete